MQGSNRINRGWVTTRLQNVTCTNWAIVIVFIVFHNEANSATSRQTLSVVPLLVNCRLKITPATRINNEFVTYRVRITRNGHRSPELFRAPKIYLSDRCQDLFISSARMPDSIKNVEGVTVPVLLLLSSTGYKSTDTITIHTFTLTRYERHPRPMNFLAEARRTTENYFRVVLSLNCW
jgi:hypothetical protein